jgi:hypothetical protein
MLVHPGFDGFSFPDAAGGEGGGRGGEVGVVPDELHGSLPGHAEHVGDLADPDEVVDHALSVAGIP